jgi:hypothetical protein
VWLRKHRGASDSTIELYGRAAAHLMAALGEDPTGWGAGAAPRVCRPTRRSSLSLPVVVSPRRRQKKSPATSGAVSPVALKRGPCSGDQLN